MPDSRVFYDVCDLSDDCSTIDLKWSGISHVLQDPGGNLYGTGSCRLLSWEKMAHQDDSDFF